MLYLYQSNRLETLADILTALHQSAPLQGSLAAEEIIVQSQGMRRFLSIHLAQTTGIAANLNFQLPAGWTWRLMRQFIPNTPTLSPFAPEVMRWRLFGLFQSPEFQSSAFTQSRQALEGYLNSSDQAAYQLAGQLSDIFDQYLVYRATWINAWKAGKLLDLGAEEIWQAELWRFLDDDRQSAPHRRFVQNAPARSSRRADPDRIRLPGLLRQWLVCPVCAGQNAQTHRRQTERRLAGGAERTGRHRKTA